VTVLVHSGTTPGTGRLPTEDVVVDSCRSIADRVLLVSVRHHTRHQLPVWVPGAHIDVTTPCGLERQYSLCGDPTELERWEFAVLNEPEGRGGSASLHAAARPGLHLQVRGPRNHFRLVNAERYLFVAGGIGIAPLRPMINLVASHGRHWQLAYCGRRLSAMAFADELVAMGDAVRLYPGTEVAHLDVGSLVASAQPGTALYCCGPARLIDDVAAHCATRADLDLHIVRFVPMLGRTPSITAPLFVVHLARSGTEVRVDPGRSILEALRDSGCSVPFSCTEGVCGACEVRVLGGTPDHRDSILTDVERQESDCMFVCVSGSAGGDLILDL